MGWSGTGSGILGPRRRCETLWAEAQAWRDQSIREPSMIGPGIPGTKQTLPLSVPRALQRGTGDHEGETQSLKPEPLRSASSTARPGSGAEPTGGRKGRGGAVRNRNLAEAGSQAGPGSQAPPSDLRGSSPAQVAEAGWLRAYRSRSKAAVG